MANNVITDQTSHQNNITEQPDPFDPAPHRDVSFSTILLFCLALGVIIFNFVANHLKK
ncbi:hypothetical protein [Zymomonas mobilis]|uniref:hypothetical protein n=1 Tax=Zymomonas mobilis TaxID=542 RepID=UPI0039E9EF13